jgi:hypothetical protein
MIALSKLRVVTGKHEDILNRSKTKGVGKGPRFDQDSRRKELEKLGGKE